MLKGRKMFRQTTHYVYKIFLSIDRLNLYHIPHSRIFEYYTTVLSLHYSDFKLSIGFRFATRQVKAVTMNVVIEDIIKNTTAKTHQSKDIL